MPLFDAIGTHCAIETDLSVTVFFLAILFGFSYHGGWYLVRDGTARWVKKQRFTPQPRKKGQGMKNRNVHNLGILVAALALSIACVHTTTASNILAGYDNGIIRVDGVVGIFAIDSVGDVAAGDVNNDGVDEFLSIGKFAGQDSLHYYYVAPPHSPTNGTPWTELFNLDNPGSVAANLSRLYPLATTLASGDIDPTKPGDELVLGTADGRIIVLGEFGAVSIFAIDSVSDVAVGDVDPTIAGDEIVVVGKYAGNDTLHIFYLATPNSATNPTPWHEIFNADTPGKVGANGHRLRPGAQAVAVGNADPTTEANEIVLGFQNGKISVDGIVGVFAIDSVTDIAVGDVNGDDLDDIVFVGKYAGQDSLHHWYMAPANSLNNSTPWNELWNLDSHTPTGNLARLRPGVTSVAVSADLICVPCEKIQDEAADALCTELSTTPPTSVANLRDMAIAAHEAASAAAGGPICAPSSADACLAAALSGLGL
jgi:hypothetical protein